MEDKSEQLTPTILSKDVKQKIDSRLGQSNGSRLSEVITGLTPEDPQIVDRLIQMQDQIYQKYGLPDISLMLTNPNLLHQKINEILDKNQIPFLTKDKTKEFFEKYPDVYAAYFRNLKSIGINTEKQKNPSYSNQLFFISLLHETTHAVQEVNNEFDSSSIEMLEFEATLATTILSPLKDLDYRATIPEKNIQESIVFLFDSICFSVENWESQGGTSNRSRYTAENLLKTFDGITSDQINSYKKQVNSQTPKP